MSLADKKRDVFTTIGSYKSLMEEGKSLRQSDLFSSINNKDEIVPYLIDLLKTIAGTESLKEVIGGMFTSLLGEVEPKLKIALKKQFTKLNADDVVPTEPINIPVKTIDVKGVFKSSPDSEAGNLVYGSIEGFNKKAYDAISNSGTEVNIFNLTLKYDINSDGFEIKPSDDSGTIGEFFNDFIDETELIDKKEIVSNVMDAVYGTITASQDKTIEQAYSGLQIDSLLNQVLDGDDSMVLSSETNEELLVRATEIVEGVVNYDMGCGLMSAKLHIDDLTSLVANISGSTDQFYVGNQIENSINESSDAETETMTAKNKQTIKDGFFQKIIKIFTLKLMEAVTVAPQVRLLLGLSSSFENGVVMLDNAVDDMKNIIVYIKCMAKEIISMVVEYIFNIAIGYLVLLIKPVIKEVIKEKINQYADIMTSLTGVLNKAKGIV